MPRSFTLAIPTHNRSALLAQTLESLLALKTAHDHDVELVVVADACTDETADVFHSFRGRLPFESRYVNAEFRNLNCGRNACVENARGDIVIFLDDDVWVDPDLVSGHGEVFDSTPASITSGHIELWWRDVSRPAWMSTWTASLLTERHHTGAPARLRYPFEAAGANFAMKRDVAKQIGGFRPGLDRSGTSLLAGGETEFIKRAMSSGMELWSAPRAKVQHYVSANRVDGTRYIRGVAKGLGMSHVYMRDTFGPLEVCRQLFGRSAHCMQDLLRARIANMRGNESGKIDSQCHFDLSCGALRATMLRTLGRSPVPHAVPTLTFQTEQIRSSRNVS